MGREKERNIEIGSQCVTCHLHKNSIPAMLLVFIISHSEFQFFCCCFLFFTSRMIDRQVQQQSKMRGFLNSFESFHNVYSYFLGPFWRSSWLKWKSCHSISHPSWFSLSLVIFLILKNGICLTHPVACLRSEIFSPAILFNLLYNSL